ncbi:gluconokinase [Altericroceibacterium xinjiangense]|uniref:gluconokinase n=1 Tax=Altericroceibacterium xinjiangense TaxID=762261 RepID=UPI0019D09071|nr:gluconokinase [Altericroceibacterium xinjiangense]
MEKSVPIVVIGPSGNGKSTLGLALAQALGREFLEGDLLHPAANIAKMGRGEALTDEDRRPFLNAVGRLLAEAEGGIVASCSALRRSYRDRLRGFVPDALFVWPNVPPEELRRRVSARRNHFMPPALLASQLATFDPPERDEQAIEVDGRLPVAEQVRFLLSRLQP